MSGPDGITNTRIHEFHIVNDRLNRLVPQVNFRRSVVTAALSTGPFGVIRKTPFPKKGFRPNPFDVI